MIDAERRAAVRLALVNGVGPRIRQALVERFGSAEAVFAASGSDLQATPGVGAKLSRRIASAERDVDLDAQFELCREHQIELLTEADDAYPRLLHEIPDPPGVLFCRGELRENDGLAVAVVGTRHATQYGLRQAERLGGAIARAGFTVVSGLARGVDGAAHRGALNAGGRTIAVLGSGVLNVYPPEHKRLAEEVVRNGALLSEAPPRAAPTSGSFPQRNRLITGMSLGLVVVEASERSGALISAEHAMQQGREVFAVPGPIDSRASRGCHRLLREGARLVETIDDILEELGPLVEATPLDSGQIVHHPAELQLNEQEQKVISAVAAEPTVIDEVVAASGLPVQRVLATLSVLEVRRLIRRVGGNRVMRAH